MSFSNLKGLDRAKVDLLRMASEEAELDLYLCLVNLIETYSSHPTMHWTRNHAGGYSLFHEAPDNESTPYYHVRAKHLVSPSGKEADWLDLHVNMTPATALDHLLDDEPDGVSVDLYTGNDGASMDKWYSQAALLLWPKQHKKQNQITNLLMLP